MHQPTEPSTDARLARIETLLEVAIAQLDKATQNFELHTRDDKEDFEYLKEATYQLRLQAEAQLSKSQATDKEIADVRVTVEALRKDVSGLQFTKTKLLGIATGVAFVVSIAWTFLKGFFN